MIICDGSFERNCVERERFKDQRVEFYPFVIENQGIVVKGGPIYIGRKELRP